MIDSYRFGKIIIDNRTFTSDIIIYPDHIEDNWWRKEGHNLRIDDIRDIIAYSPDVLIIGKGEPGYMQVPPDIKHCLKSKNIEVIVENTKRACATYNRLYKMKKTIAALHLTC